MTSSTVIVVGCGIAGPVMALLLLQKGYSPIIVEKVKELGDAGGALGIMPNGLKVLSLVDLDKTVASLGPAFQEITDRSYTGEILGTDRLPATWPDLYGQPGVGLLRTNLNLSLKNKALGAGIPVHEGWSLKDIKELDDRVIAISEDGREIEGSFLIGCDGIKAMSREIILQMKGIPSEPAEFTGISQIGGISPIPKSFEPRGVTNIYGPSAHFLFYSITPSKIHWGVTQKATLETKESWKHFDSTDLQKTRQELQEELKDWCTPVPELIRTIEKGMKYGVHDRPQLEPSLWYTKRCVLVGDAAHPTSPHLGQGANQAMEDCYHLFRLLPDNGRNETVSVSSSKLESAFKTFAELRQPRTAALVKAARKQGELRTMNDSPEACAERDRLVKNAFADEEASKRKWKTLFSEPF